MRSGETPSAAFDALRRYLWKPTCKDLATKNIAERIRKKCTDTLVESFDKDVAIICSTSQRIAKMEENEKNGFNWFPNYWLTFQLAALPARSKCFPCFDTNSMKNVPKTGKSRKQVRADIERKIKKAKYAETPNPSSSSKSAKTPSTPLNPDENKFEVVHINKPQEETDIQKTKFKIDVFMTKIKTLEEMNTDGSYSDRIREARLHLMNLLDKASEALF